MKYQEIMNLDIENIASTSQNNWRSIYEFIHDDDFKSVKLLSSKFLRHSKRKNEPQNIPYESKAVFKIWIWNKGCMHK